MKSIVQSRVTRRSASCNCNFLFFLWCVEHSLGISYGLLGPMCRFSTPFCICSVKYLQGSRPSLPVFSPPDWYWWEREVTANVNWLFWWADGIKTNRRDRIMKTQQIISFQKAKVIGRRQIYLSMTVDVIRVFDFVKTFGEESSTLLLRDFRFRNLGGVDEINLQSDLTAWGKWFVCSNIWWCMKSLTSKHFRGHSVS